MKITDFLKKTWFLGFIWKRILTTQGVEHSKAVTTVSPNRLNSRENKKMFHYSLKILYYNSETKAAKPVELKNLLLHLEV